MDPFTTKRPDRRGLLATLAFSGKDGQSLKLCALCARFQIKVVAEVPDDEVLLVCVVSQHRIHQEYDDIYPAFPGMKKRANDGCTFCTFILRSLEAEYRTSRQRVSNGVAVQILLTASMYERVEDGSALAMLRSQEPHTLKVLVRTRDEESTALLTYDVTFQMTAEAPTTSQNPLSSTNIDMVIQWLRECDARHSFCGTPLTEYTPTRLLSVKDGMLRLVTKKTERENYVALSYCWGRSRKDHKLFQTIKSNLTARLRGFQMEELPHTLQDAIQVVRALKIEYIWIDALCILQDDPDDWIREASCMNKVYGHAYLTIAAANSMSSFDGFLRTRESCKASLGFTFDDIQPTLPERKADETGTIHFRYPRATDIDDHLVSCKWDTRGWTLQEKLCSTRILYFTQDVLYYECATSQKVENSGYKLPKPQDFSMQLTQSKSLTLPEKRQKREHYLSTWYQVVESYTSRNLTRPGDKFPAMEGLAAMMRGLVDDEYVFGLWKSDLYRGLLWHSSWGSTWKIPRGGYRAPTWSWASRDGRVFWDVSTFKSGWKSLMEVASISPRRECTHCNQMIDTRLELVAPVAPLREVLYAFEEPTGEAEYLDDWEEVDTWDGYEELGSFEIDCNDDMPISLADTKMMLVAERAETRNYQALLIQPDSAPDCFKRIGWFIHKETREALKEEDSEGRNFGPLRRVFKPERILLV